jgi:LPXTG-motif cell wall-anchored protein
MKKIARSVVAASAAGALGLGLVLIGGVAPASAGTGTEVFTTTGSTAFVVPAGVTLIQVIALGGSGGGLSTVDPSLKGGAGALITADLPVTPGATYHVHVGGNGAVTTGGANGGGAGGNSHGGGGGGGATDFRSAGDTLADRLLVAGGGGGLSTYFGGADASLNSGSVNFCFMTGSTAGSQVAGGVASANGCGGGTGTNGALGQGGNAGVAGGGQAAGGGGGGGGLFGGGGGNAYAGGAGGSSFWEPTATNTSSVTGTFGQAPAVRIFWDLTGATVGVTTSAPKILADGASTAVITATVLDASNNKVPGDTVTITSNDPGQVVSAVTDNGDGTYTATVTSSTTIHVTTLTATDTSVQSDPSGIVTVSQVASLAETGVDAWPALGVAGLLVLVGMLFVFSRRGRRSNGTEAS